MTGSVKFKSLPNYTAFTVASGETFIKIGRRAALSAVDGCTAAPFRKLAQVIPACVGVRLRDIQTNAV